MQMDQDINRAEELLVLTEFSEAFSAARTVLLKNTYSVGSSGVKQRATAVLLQALYELGRSENCF